MTNSHQPMDQTKEEIVKNSLRNLRLRFVLVHKTKLRAWQAMLITVFVAGFASAIILAASQDWFERILSAPEKVVTNQAFVTYQDSRGNSYSNQTNIVSTTIIEQQGAAKILLNIQPEGETSDFARTITFYVYSAGTTNLIISGSSPCSSTGELAINVDTLSAGLYDLKMRVPYCLSLTVSNINFSGTDIDLRETLPLRSKAGNLQDADDIVNVQDWAIMSANWGTSHESADINRDGLVNTLDWSLMNKNWLLQGETVTL